MVRVGLYIYMMWLNQLLHILVTEEEFETEAKICGNYRKLDIRPGRISVK